MASRSPTPFTDETHPLSPEPPMPGSPAALLSPQSQLSPGISSPTSPSLGSRSRVSRHLPSEQQSDFSRPGSMVLYRLADEPMSPSIMNQSDEGVLLPPNPQFDRSGRASRSSTLSMGAASTRSSFISFSGDSKYPFMAPGMMGGANLRDSTFSAVAFSSIQKRERGLVPYEYDPAADELDPPDEEDLLHDPGSNVKLQSNVFPWRGFANISVLIIIILAILCLFIFYPVINTLRNEKKNAAIDGNIRINATGQAPVLFGLPSLIDVETTDDVKTRTGFDGNSYSLVFSDEFNTAGRTFYPGDDPFWEAADLWYGATGDIEWYDPSQVTTRDGALVITIDSADVTTPLGTPNSTAPFTVAENHNLTYRSGMLQSWNKFCFSSGYIEVGIILPGPNENTQGYWPGAWTMGNLARPGYSATTDGTWPYTYDSCDVGSFSNQTLKDKSGPPAALHSDWSRSKYNFELSWLSGQKLSACSCPSSDHPGPIKSDGSYTGRGSPEIDILEAELDKLTGVGQVVSQSAQFAPFTHDYVYLNDTADEFSITDASLTRANPYRGSAVQQAVSGLTKVPTAGFFGASGRQFVKYGFEYWGDPSKPGDGYIQWMVDGKPSNRMGASAVGPDPIESPSGVPGSGVGQRLIPVEPMSIILNLGLSNNWQALDLPTMTFPTEMLVDYVRVYQKDGHTNVGCDPPDFPTKSYIDSHLDAFTNVNLTAWPYEKPKNSAYDGC
ncbi:beta-glucan synthesis-associated [Mycena floridula]|nr:beta-glucan synthesis-associated [Mycena floridula]